MALQTHSNIIIGQNEIPSFEAFHINQKIGEHHSFELVCRLDVLESEAGVIATNTQEFLGETITISTEPDFQTSDYETLNFKGIITEVINSKDVKNIESDVVILKGFSNTIICDDGPNYFSHEEKTIDQIINDTIANYDQSLLSADCNPRFTNTIAYSVQQQESAFNYMARLAKQYGEWFYYNGVQLIFGAPEEDEPLELKHTINLKRYSLSLKPKASKYKFFNNNFLTEENLEKNSSEVTTNTQGLNLNITNKAEQIFSVETNQYLNTYVDSTLQNRVDSLVEISKKATEINQVILKGTSDNPGVFLGQVIKVMDGDTSQGTFRITSIKHSCSYNGDYENSFESVSAEMDSYPNTDINAFPKSESQVAKVIDNVDPDGMSRVKVQFPWQVAMNLSSPWIRVITPSSGADKGFHFIPEVEEEVLIGFEAGNAERPYVIGSLYTGVNKPDSWQSDANNLKAIRTRSGHTIELNDTEGEETIRIYDNEGSIIEFNTQEKSLTINATETIDIAAKNINITAEENISIGAQGDIEVAADGDLSNLAQGDVNIQSSGDTGVKSSGAVTIEATTDATLQGMNAIVEGKTGAELNGVQAKVAGSAMTEISGAIVKVN